MGSSESAGEAAVGQGSAIGVGASVGSVGRYAGPGLLELVTALSPRFRRPAHLGDWCSVLERSIEVYRGGAEPVRALCSVPIRHWKTWTGVHGIVWMLIQIPDLRIILLTHEYGRANAIGKDLRQLAEAADVGPTRGWNTITEWRNKNDGGAIVMSADQSKLGYDCHVLMFDDPIDERAVQNVELRNNVDETIAHYTARCQRNGKRGPVLGVASRWHQDDPHGRRILRGWSYIHHPAIIDEGLGTERAFAPDVIGLEELKKIRAEKREQDPSERLWYAQFQGDPRPATGDIRAPARYEDIPRWPGFRDAIGTDLVYSSSKTSDWYAMVSCRFYGSNVFLLNVQRMRTDLNTIEQSIRGEWLTLGSKVPVFSYMSGPERGVAHYFHTRGIPVQAMPARWDKRTRAQHTLDLWNSGRLLVPLHASWPVDAFISRVMGFTGQKDAGDDDEIDALSSVVDAMTGVGGGMGGVPASFGERRYG